MAGTKRKSEAVSVKFDSPAKALPESVNAK
jgi:hypothetical protein